VGLAVALVFAAVGFVAVEALAGTPWRVIAPLHLCDVAVFVGGYALVTRRQLACELLYFWGCAGTTGALLAPELAESFPHFRFVFYFLQHGLVVVAALVVTLGMGLRPRCRAPLGAWLWLNAYGVVVALVNVVFGTNFLYLCARPSTPSPLDWFGEWPLYVVAGEGVALALFYLLMLPFACFTTRAPGSPGRLRSPRGARRRG
jgi:hypothetical integral membrane protein (TIGR02206 family)